MEKREKFSSRLGFILISAGCAIGLGNVYRFPIYAGKYGGALFVLIYLVFLVLLGIPVMTAELGVGRASQKSIVSSFDVLQKPGQKWHFMRYIGIAGNYLLMMFYTVISGWMAIYLFKYLDGSILSAETTTDTMNVFVDTITNPGLTFGVAAALIIICFGICALGLKNGVEKITKVMMVILLVLMLGLAVYSLTLNGAGEGLKFYLVPSVERISNYNVFDVISAAMGQAFFTLSIGIGSIAIFGSYIGKEKRLLGESLTIVGLDTFVALIAGLIIFPSWFTFNPGNQNIPKDGALVLFQTLTNLFNQMGPVVGRIIGAVFFLFMLFAAMSTIIAVFENIMSFWTDLTPIKRPIVAGINVLIFLVAILPVIFGNKYGWTILPGKDVIDSEDFVVSNLLLPIGSLCYVLFCSHEFGWGWDNALAEINCGDGLTFPKVLKNYMKYALPVIIVFVLVLSILRFFGFFA